MLVRESAGSCVVAVFVLSSVGGSVCGMLPADRSRSRGGRCGVRFRGGCPSAMTRMADGSGQKCGSRWREGLELYDGGGQERINKKKGVEQ